MYWLKCKFYIILKKIKLNKKKNNSERKKMKEMTKKYMVISLPYQFLEHIEDQELQQN